ncbi:serine acetyltransferase [Facklamia sp. P12945]|uniref:serine acetyltransferase n=1 Tax=Facklamia sp. P12945 TaxID=3421950 RepID=UPI003D17A00D
MDTLNNYPKGKIESKKDLKQFLIIESKRYGRRNISNPLFLIKENDFLWRHNILLRKTEYYLNTRNKVMGLTYKFLLKRFQNRYMLHIPINSFGCGLKIMHLGPILVNGKVKAGRNISIHINTSIVAGGNDDATPRLEDGVVIGVGAVILGPVTIAKNIAIGANAVVNKSFFEENIAIAGVPAKKISDNGRLSWLKNRK